MAKKITYDPSPAVWHVAKKVHPDDNRDVLAYLHKPVYVEASKRFELMEAMEVIHMEGNGFFFYNGKPLQMKQVHKWTEIPTGWQRVNGQ